MSTFNLPCILCIAFIYCYIYIQCTYLQMLQIDKKENEMYIAHTREPRIERVGIKCSTQTNVQVQVQIIFRIYHVIFNGRDIQQKAQDSGHNQSKVRRDRSLKFMHVVLLYYIVCGGSLLLHTRQPVYLFKIQNVCYMNCGSMGISCKTSPFIYFRYV